MDQNQFSLIAVAEEDDDELELEFEEVVAFASHHDLELDHIVIASLSLPPSQHSREYSHNLQVSWPSQSIF